MPDLLNVALRWVVFYLAGFAFTMGLMGLVVLLAGLLCFAGIYIIAQ